MCSTAGTPGDSHLQLTCACYNSYTKISTPGQRQVQNQLCSRREALEHLLGVGVSAHEHTFTHHTGVTFSQLLLPQLLHAANNTPQILPALQQNKLLLLMKQHIAPPTDLVVAHAPVALDVCGQALCERLGVAVAVAARTLVAHRLNGHALSHLDGGNAQVGIAGHTCVLCVCVFIEVWWVVGEREAGAKQRCG